MPTNELEMFLNAWEYEAENTLKLLRALPVNQYDFRPDAGGRSLGELAWHIAEGDAYMSYARIDTGRFTMEAKPPNIERPRSPSRRSRRVTSECTGKRWRASAS